MYKHGRRVGSSHWLVAWTTAPARTGRRGSVSHAIASLVSLRSIQFLRDIARMTFNNIPEAVGVARAGAVPDRTPRGRRSCGARRPHGRARSTTFRTSTSGAAAAGPGMTTSAPSRATASARERCLTVDPVRARRSCRSARLGCDSNQRISSRRRCARCGRPEPCAAARGRRRAGARRPAGAYGRCRS
jgi:hypothetical protein